MDWETFTETIRSVKPAPLAQLQALSLDGLPVTDAGLKELTGFKQLHTLTLFDTKVSRAGVAELRKALPKLAVAAAPLK